MTVEINKTCIGLYFVLVQSRSRFVERNSVGPSFAQENHRPVWLTHKRIVKWPLSVFISELLALTACITQEATSISLCVFAL